MMDNGTSTQQQQHHQQQQQFCLRWHNHQTSLLSSLPLLLDQSHLTDVTISTEGKTLKAHRVVLSACSSFFSELFRTLDPSNHPVIVIPGASFGDMVALLTFMYSGEVNVFEGQIPTLLALAETLGIKGLADFQNNLQNSSKDDDTQYPNKDMDTPSPTPTPTKLTSPLENFFMKSLQFYPNLIPQPLNFSQSALNKTTEFLAKYQQQCNLLQSNAKESSKDDGEDEKKNNSGDKNKPKDTRKIDKIAENLRTISGPKSDSPNKLMMHLNPSPLVLRPTNFPVAQHFQIDDKPKSAEAILEHGSAPFPNVIPENVGHTMTSAGDNPILEKTITNPQQTKTANSKLYATCFICHKQLSNQYNLRVHLETHQNVRYACNVCSHVSRSKDALRKHVSYRHPGAPSPCESEARRKRAKAASTAAFPNLLKASDLTENQMNQQAFLFMQNQFQQQSATMPSVSCSSQQGIGIPSTSSQNTELLNDLKREAQNILKSVVTPNTDSTPN